LAASALLSTTAATAQPDPRIAAAFSQLPAWTRSVVLIRVYCPGQATPYMGTGVLVRASGEVLTAAHVGSACPGVTEAKIGAVRSPYSAPGEELMADLVHRVADDNLSPDSAALGSSSYRDLAVWKIRSLAGSTLAPATLSPDFPVPGEEVEIVGFSGLPFWHANNAGRNAGPGLTRFRTSLSSIAASTADIPYRLHYTGATLPGVSGGPVFDRQGRLLGIHSGRTTGTIENLVKMPCTPPSWGNCETVGVNYQAVKAPLDNYSWATSILAVPTGWLP
jgi:S1-C subfamily serine protease